MALSTHTGHCLSAVKINRFSLKTLKDRKDKDEKQFIPGDPGMQARLSTPQQGIRARKLRIIIWKNSVQEKPSAGAGTRHGRKEYSV